MSDARVIAQTERLVIRRITPDDAAFVLELINTPKFHRYIADRGVRDLDAARLYVEERYLKPYREHGCGLFAVCLHDGTPIGNCGFVRRDTLPGPDIGFAFLEAFEGRGYAFEAATAVLEYGRTELGYDEVFAITVPENAASIGLLRKLGFDLMDTIVNDGEKLNLFRTELRAAGA